MNDEQIIQAKISFLSGESQNDLSAEMNDFVAKDSTLEQELNFIEKFWNSTKEVTDELPSSQLSNNFYAMLDQAKSVQQSTQQTNQRAIEASKEKNKSTFFQLIENLFTAKPVLQFATIMMVFTLGYYLNQPQYNEHDEAMANLQKQVTTLNSMVALSMIQKSSASERLAGVSYSKQSNVEDETLTMALIELLNSDSSSAVRLAVIDAVYTRGSILNLQDNLLESIPKQSNALVQMGLIRLILEKGDALGKRQVIEMKTLDLLMPEVADFIEQNKAVIAI
ncbi:MAG: hypothetical protein ACI9IA_000163 [Enterobacterales bacterium]|jgi:hypothetical protein